MTTYRYYLQTGGSIRRYEGDASTGLRWDKNRRGWSQDCAPQRACQLTKDALISEMAVTELISK